MIDIGNSLSCESDTLYPGDRLSRPWLDLERLHLRFTQPIASYGFRSSAAFSRPISSPASAILDAICRLGEISACVTKGKDKLRLAEECADLMILVLGTAIAADLDLKQAFWNKMTKLDRRGGRFVNGRIRVSEFD